jgi:deazaflavin-dependent oxidoreductase (nitroreductase family)
MAREYRLGAVRRLINVVVSALVRLGIGPKHTYLLTTTGRTTGRRYTTPVFLIEHPDERWLVSPYGERGWVKNARTAGSVELGRGRESARFAIEELGPDESAPILQEYLREVRIVQPFFDVRPDSPLEAFAAEAPRHPVFRLHPA